jgi:predicted permease
VSAHRSSLSPIAVLLTPPPFADPDAVFVVGETRLDEPPSASRAVAYDRFEAWRDRARSLATFEAFDGTFLTLTGLGAAERCTCHRRHARVSEDDWRCAGSGPVVRARRCGSDGDRRERCFWRGKLASDPNAIGRQVLLGGRSHVVIGVLPPHLRLVSERMCGVRSRAGLGSESSYVWSRDASPSQLATVLDDVSRVSSPPFRAVATPVAAALAGDRVNTIGLLAGAAALAMVLAFTNLAGLLMVRSIDRRRELAVRSALGAGRSEVVRQLLLEAGALIAIGIAGGVVLAFWITPAFAQIVVQQLGPIANRAVVVSWRVIGIVSAIAFTCAVVCVWVPAVAAARWRVVDVLRRGATASRRELTLRQMFVAGEVAAAFVLLVSMTLLSRTLMAALHIDPGFEARGVMTLRVSLPVATYATDERVASFYALLQHAMEERLGRGTASIVDELPLTHDRGRRLVSAAPSDAPREAVVRSASPGYFEVLRIPITAGRSFDRQDDAGAPPRVVLSSSLATRLFGSESPVGRLVSMAGAARVAEVIGVAGDVKHRALDEATRPTLYVLCAPGAVAYQHCRRARRRPGCHRDRCRS